MKKIFAMILLASLPVLASAQSYKIYLGNPSGVKIPEEPLPDFYLSCKDLLQKDPSAPSGNYMLKPSGASEMFEAYCDMDTNGGGWTRIAERVNYSTPSGSNQVLLRNMIPKIPSYSSVRQPSFVTRDCASCGANSLSLYDINNSLLTSFSSRKMSGTPYTAYSSSQRIIYKATWSGMGGGSSCGISDGVGHAGCGTQYVYVK